MNTPRNGIPPVDEHDWQAQEAAMTAPQHRADALLAQAVRSLPATEPPPGFAAEVARYVAARAHADGVEDARLDRLLFALLVAVFVLSAAVVVAMYGGRWWAMMGQALGGSASWLLAGAACLGLSWVLGDGRRLFAPVTPVAG